MKLRNMTVVGALLAAMLIPVAATSASATYEECVPQDAWTEVIEHPAVGEPTILIDNPDYIPADGYEPAVGEPQIEVENPDYVPASTENVDHPAVTCPPVEVPPGGDARSTPGRSMGGRAARRRCRAARSRR